MHALGSLYLRFITQTPFSVLSLVTQNLNPFKLALGIQLGVSQRTGNLPAGTRRQPCPQWGWNALVTVGYDTTLEGLSPSVSGRNPKVGSTCFQDQGLRNIATPCCPPVLLAHSMKQLTGEIGQTIKLDGGGGNLTEQNVLTFQPPRQQESKRAMCVIIYANHHLLCSPYCDIQSALLTYFCSHNKT